MSRARLAYLPLALAVAGCLVVPAVASAAGRDNPPTACTKSTREVTNLTTTVTNLGTALQATPPDPTKLSQVAGDLFTAVTAAQTAGCLPPLPASPIPAPTPAPPPPTTHAQDVAKCAADAVSLLSAALDQVAAGTAATPDSSAVLAAATRLAAAITAVNTDACLPVTLPVPSVPAPPAPPVPPVS
jgi:hypothetical protein